MTKKQLIRKLQKQKQIINDAKVLVATITLNEKLPRKLNHQVALFLKSAQSIDYDIN